MFVASAVAGTLAASGPARADVTAPPALSRSHPLQPPPPDPKGEVQELLRQVSELDDQWNSLPPAQRNQRLAALQQQATTVDRETRNLPPDQQPEVEGMLGLAVLRLADIMGKMRAAS
ncbi:hypothetical protein [Mycobacterium sp. E2327]|uniref:hypothetical protein n=1 Tax=Mycobacterium sp. E2327 TaxID=1834132 RepID=UPI0012EAD030|nr:hypothetical protein [Mycobacterium sp. E2327]